MSTDDSGWGGFTPTPPIPGAPATQPPPADAAPGQASAAPSMPPDGRAAPAQPTAQEILHAATESAKKRMRNLGVGTTASGGGLPWLKGMTMGAFTARLKTDRKMQIQAAIVAAVLLFGINFSLHRNQAPSKEAYIRKMDNLCAELQPKVRALGSNATPVQYVPIVEEALKKQKAFKQPKGEKAQLQLIFSNGDAFLASLRTGDLAQVAQAQKVSADSNKAYGFRVC